MFSQTLYYGLLIALAIALVFAAFTDIRRRQIDNWLNLAIVVAAPLFWWSSGMAFWPDVAIQFGFAVGVCVVLMGLYALGVMGGGDLKLLTALALWLSPMAFLDLLIIMAIVGGGLAMMFLIRKIMMRIKSKEQVKLPYGVAIATGGLWVLSTTYFPHDAIAAVAP
ncbi:MAG: prepilin peptidase [Pseudomonadota bacterium]